MKKLFVSIFSVSLLFLTTAVLAQDKPANPGPSKGYYSIGKNADSLPANKKPARETRVNPEAPVVTKGYYSIGKNREKLQKPTARIVIGDMSPVRKGYYSIPPHRKSVKE